MAPVVPLSPVFTSQISRTVACRHLCRLCLYQLTGGCLSKQNTPIACRLNPLTLLPPLCSATPAGRRPDRETAQGNLDIQETPAEAVAKNPGPALMAAREARRDRRRGLRRGGGERGAAWGLRIRTLVVGRWADVCDVVCVLACI